MIGAKKYASATLPYYGKKELVIDDHTTPDIMEEIRVAHKDYAPEYDLIAEDFWNNDVENTAHTLFNVLKKNVKYDVENPYNQQIKSPGAIFQQKHGDCKHYASVIIGVADALRRKGHKIKGSYRFVADMPEDPRTGKKMEVHHVFAVLSDGHNEYWVDPVLSTFNMQPVFYNTKDIDMCALYRVSGTGVHDNDYNTTDQGRPRNLPMVGKSKKKNVFKQIAHGISVDAHNAGKEVAKDAKKVEHVVLNVGAAPARNAFLALLDINGFNLATRMSDAWTNHQKEVGDEWEKLGGNKNKLLAAINNGRKHKAFYHDQAPATKLSGTMEQFLEGGYLVIPCEMRRAHNIRHAYDQGEDHNGRLPVVSGIGEPVSIATLSALAAAIIGVFEKYMKKDPGTANAAAAATDGIANLVQNASDAIDAGGDTSGGGLLNTANNLVKAANAVPGAAPTMQIAAGTAPDGTPTVAVTDFSHPQLDNAGTPTGGVQPPGTPNVPGATPADQGGGSADGDGGDAPDPGGSGKPAPKKDLQKAEHNIVKSGKDLEKEFESKVKQYKTPLMIAGATAGVTMLMGTSKKMKHYKGLVIGAGLFGVIVTAINTNNH